MRRPPRGWTVLGAIGLVAVALLILHCRATASLHTDAGDPRGELMIGSGHDAKIVLVDRVGAQAFYWGFRIAVIDMTGRLLAERVFDDFVECKPASGDAIWCVMSDHGDPPRLLFAIPDLTELPPDNPAGSGTGKETGCNGTDSLPFGTDRLVFGDGPRYRLIRRPAELEQAHEATPPAEATTFLGKSYTPSFLDLDPALILVVHDRSLDPTAVAQISRLDDRLQPRWTADLGKELIARCRLATLAGRTLVIAMHDASSRVVGIDVDTGKVLWRFAFDD